ncbi:MAG: sulfatase-like hydrolase/transferase [Alphaproteobacteria bacterium]|nr:sulfatase-like hydrolase/transferase [Alphaproteobacteria bacterium]
MKQRIPAVIVALLLLVGGFGVARYAANRPGAHRAAKAKAKARKAKARKAKSSKSAKSKGKAKVGAPATGGALGDPILAGDPVEPVLHEHPNVVLIIGCTVRQDQVTPYGGHVEATPFLADRATHGALFEHAITAAPWTKAASAAIVTGHHPAEIGMVEPSERPSRRRVPDEVTTAAELFSQGGYQTFGATANPNLNEVFGFGQGFDGYVEGTELWRLGGRAKVNARALMGASLPMLAEIRDPSRPLYLQFLFTDAHSPSHVRPNEAKPFQGDVPPKVATYRAMLRRFDLAVEVLAKSLAHQGLTDENTVFVVVSDHGEGLQHPSWQGYGHGNFTYPATVRMPWIAWGAGVAPGRRIGGMASQIDILPTLAGLVGVDGYEGPGLSWADALRGDADRTTRELAFVDTWFQSARRSGVYAEDLHCHEDWARVEGDIRVPRACYDQDVVPEPVTGERADALLAELDAFHTRMEASFASYPYTIDAEPPEDVAEQLEALGYVDGGEGVVE